MQARNRAICLGLLILGIAASVARAQDPVAVAPDKYTVRLENDRVRVLEYRDQPGDKAEMHSHPDFIVYFMSSSKRRFTLPDGRTIVAPAQAPGTVLWRNATTHAGENIGTDEEHVLIIELKN